MKLEVILANARQLKPYFKYLRLVPESGADTEEVKTALSLRKLGTVITLDIKDLKNNNARIKC